jgi:hypothetical protein
MADSSREYVVDLLKSSKLDFQVTDSPLQAAYF